VTTVTGFRNRSIPGVAALGCAAALAVSSVAGASTSPTSQHQPGAVHRRPAGQLSVTAKIDLGAFSAVALDEAAFAQAPNDIVYFSSGSVVKAVKGNAAPVVVEHAAGKVLALAATNSHLYLEVGSTITEYTLPGMAVHKTWSWPNPGAKPTTAGLFPEPAALWVWTDWATDQSGFEYAEAIEIPGTSFKFLDAKAFPGDMAANSTGLYYETVVGSKDYLAHLANNGIRNLSAPTKDSDAPLALSGGDLAVFAINGSGEPYVDEFSTSTLSELHSSHLKVMTTAVVGTTGGVLAIEFPCHGYVCPSSRVVRVNPATGAETGGVVIPDAEHLLFGTHPSAVADTSGKAYLVRLS
jgi:hypothetical protein